MAFDEWLLSRAMSNPGAIYLRVYTWQTPTITFGYSQKQETALDFSNLGDTPVIRRVTGGRALYHDPSELTYSIAANTDLEPGARLGGTLSRSSRLIAEMLTETLTRLGISSDYVRHSSSRERVPDYFHKAPCFGSFSRHELQSAGRKVVASAQKRLSSAFLQHGSVKIGGLAFHPSLPGVGLPSGARLQAVGEKRLIDSARQFRDCFECGLEVSFVTHRLSEADRRDLRALEQGVKKNALERRVIIAQFDNRVSL
jgi:hypothetical protein